MKCKFCGAEVKLGERCQYCGSCADRVFAGIIAAEKNGGQDNE